MNGSNGAFDTAGRNENLCPVCLRKFVYSCEQGIKNCWVDIVGRYRDILESYERLNTDFPVDEDEDIVTGWYRDRIEKLTTCQPCGENVEK